MDLPDGYAVRPAVAGDIPDIVGMCRACDLADIGVEDTNLDWFADDWRRPRFDPSTDTWLVSGPDGDIAAYGQTWEEIAGVSFDSNGWVHPDHRRRGLGRFLMRSVEVRALGDVASLPSGSAPKVHQSFADPVAAAHALMASRGYTLERTFLHMAISLDVGVQSGGMPGGFVIRPYHPGEDDRAIHAADTEAFADHWGQVPRSFEEFAAEWFGSSSFDPSLWLVGEADGEIAGFACGIIQEDRGWVTDLGVRPPWRRRGLGEALLRGMFALYATRGLPEVSLNVDADNGTGAVALYERAGMHESRRWCVYSKVLTSAI